MLILVALFAGLMASGAASAAKGHAVNATCSGGGQLCNNIATFTINVPAPAASERANSPRAPDLLQLADSFSNRWDGSRRNQLRGPREQSTPFVSLGFIGPGKHVVGVQAEGQVGGCNVGNLVSWAGK